MVLTTTIPPTHHNQTTPTRKMDALPGEVVERVLDFLPVVDFFRSGGVCKKWNRLVTTNPKKRVMVNKRDKSFYLQWKEGWEGGDILYGKYMPIRRMGDTTIRCLDVGGSFRENTTTVYLQYYGNQLCVAKITHYLSRVRFYSHITYFINRPGPSSNLDGKDDYGDLYYKRSNESEFEYGNPDHRAPGPQEAQAIAFLIKHFTPFGMKVVTFPQKTGDGRDPDYMMGDDD